MKTTTTTSKTLHMNLITSIWAKRGDEAEGADFTAGNTGAIVREDLASALASHHEADIAELPEEERAEAVEVMVDSYIAARDVRTQTAAAIAEGAPADLAAEVAFAREYAGSSADDAERRVREYAASWGTPDRETTARIARDAAEHRDVAMTIMAGMAMRSVQAHHAPVEVTIVSGGQVTVRWDGRREGRTAETWTGPRQLWNAAVEAEAVRFHRTMRITGFDDATADAAVEQARKAMIEVSAGPTGGPPDAPPRAATAQRRETMAEMIHFAVGDVAAHEGYVTKRHADDVWTPENPSGWTYQEVTHGGRVLYEGPDEEKARAELDAWLVCDAPSSGAYCYSHNPGGT